MSLAAIVGVVKGAQGILGVVKDSIALIPDPVKKQTALTELALLEKQLDTQDVEFAKSLDYELCRGHFPPEIMLDMGDFWRCSKCGRTTLTHQGQKKESDRAWDEATRQQQGLGGNGFIDFK